MEDKYVRTMEQLEKYACKWWPKEIREYADQFSILQTLLDTQEKFISILKLANRDDAKSIFRIIEASEFSMKCFLKHLMILTDVGSEPLQRMNKNFAELFPNGKMMLNENETYYFHVLPIKRRITDTMLNLESVDKDDITSTERYLLQDVIMLLLYHVKMKDGLHVANYFGCDYTQAIMLSRYYATMLTTNWNKINHVPLWERLKNKFYKLCA